MKNIVLVLAAISMFACDSSQQDNQAQQTYEETQLETQLETRQDSLLSEVMVIHDEVMPEMGRIYRLQKELTQVIDSLETEGTAAAIPVDSLKALSAQLKAADDAMMNWMRSNDFQFEGMEQEEIMEELQSEKENIIVVRDKMLNSIRQAEETLQTFENP